jgi:hypothetical protein
VVAVDVVEAWLVEVAGGDSIDSMDGHGVAVDGGHEVGFPGGAIEGAADAYLAVASGDGAASPDDAAAVVADH